MKPILKRILLVLPILCCLSPYLAITASAYDANVDLNTMGTKVYEVYLFFRNISIFFVILSFAYLGLAILFSTLYGKSEMEIDKLKKTALSMTTAVIVILVLPNVMGWIKSSVETTAWKPPTVTPFEEPDIDYNISISGGNGTNTNSSSIFDSNITFEVEYVAPADTIPFALAAPSTTSDRPKPLIVWLHGRGERYVGSGTFLGTGLPKILATWDNSGLDGFDAFVICPQITHDYNTGDWMRESAKNNVQELIDWFIATYNVDTDRIILCGHSMGGQGALYIAHEMPDYFSRLVVLSGYPSGINIAEIRIPTRGYVGTYAKGESQDSISFMNSSFMPIFGNNNTYTMECSHGEVPQMAFLRDTDGDKRSDLIKWMFS